MKRTSIVFLTFFSPAVIFSQGVFTNNVSATIEKVIADFPLDFRNIKGESVSKNAQSTTTTYNSRINIPGSIHCMINEVLVPNKPRVSWNCLLIDGVDFNTAKTEFSSLFNQISNAIIKIDGKKPFILTGTNEPPSETKKNTTIVFEMLPISGEFQKLKVELSLQNFNSRWRILLLVGDNTGQL